ncbi:hypothetical protein V8C86DRAFT_2948544 [Haematococcus lacustris]
MYGAPSSSCGPGQEQAEELQVLEDFALASDPTCRTAFMASTIPSRPWQLFLQGLAAVQMWQLQDAQDVLRRLQQAAVQGGGSPESHRAKAFAEELEARCALAAWGPSLEPDNRLQPALPLGLGALQEAGAGWASHTLGPPGVEPGTPGPFDRAVTVAWLAHKLGLDMQQGVGSWRAVYLLPPCSSHACLLSPGVEETCHTHTRSGPPLSASPCCCWHWARPAS